MGGGHRKGVPVRAASVGAQHWGSVGDEHAAAAEGLVYCMVRPSYWSEEYVAQSCYADHRSAAAVVVVVAAKQDADFAKPVVVAGFVETRLVA